MHVIQFKAMKIFCAMAVLSGFVCQTALAQDLKYPVAAVANADGTIFVADQQLPGIWAIKDGALTKFYEGSNKYRSVLSSVRCLAIDQDGKLLAGDSAMREIYRFDAEGKPTPLTGGKIGLPMSIATKGDGTLLVCDLELHCIWKVPAAGGKPEKVADVDAPVGICLDQEKRVCVLSRRATALIRIDGEGKVEKVLEKRPFSFPNQVVSDGQGGLLITDGYAKAVWKVGADMKPVKIVDGKPLENPIGIARSGDGYLITDSKAKAVFGMKADGSITKVFPK